MPRLADNRIINRVAGFLRSAGRSAFAHDAAVNKGRRKAPTATLRSEDSEIDIATRAKLISGARDIRRNFALARWAINKHLDFVSEFSFQANTGDTGLDKELESIVEWASRPLNYEVSGRFSRQEFVRLMEAHRAIDGDIGIYKAASVGKVQGIEGDRIRNSSIGWDGASIFPPVVNGTVGTRWIHGVKIAPDGTPLAYAIHRRNGMDGFTFEREVRAGLLYLHAHFDRFDQVRGTAPMAAAINSLRDVYEGIEYALAKAKIAQLFGLKFTRDTSESLGTPETQTFDEDGNVVTEDVRGRYAVDFSNGVPILDMWPGDDAAFLENKTPSAEFQAFIQTTIALSLKAFDIPYSFYDEKYVNYSGGMSASALYIKACEPKRRRIAEFLNAWLGWRLNLLIADGVLDLGGRTVSSLGWTWVPSAMPWWNMEREVAGELAAVAAGFQTRNEAIQRRTGGLKDVYQVIDERAKEEEYARKKGVKLSLGPMQVFADEGEESEVADAA